MIIDDNILVSIIIVNYNTYELTSQCIKSVYAQTKTINFEIILVDNASKECNPDDFLRLFPDVRLIKLKNNVGFSRGNNEGIEVAKGKYILLLNSDTIVLDRAIEICIDYYEKNIDKNIGILGCKLLNNDHTIQLSSIKEKISYKWIFKQNVFIYKLLRLYQVILRKKAITGVDLKIENVEYVIGAFMLSSRKLVQSVKPLDPDFFMYYEEFEWCERMKRGGYNIVYLPLAEVVHIYGGSSERFSSLRQSLLSKSLYFLKTKGFVGYVIFLLMSSLNVLCGLIVYPFSSLEKKRKFSKEAQVFISTVKELIMVPFDYKPKYASSKNVLKIQG